MEQSDTLLTLAEIAVALAGFSSLVTVLDRNPDPASRVQVRNRLQMMLEIGLRNAGFAVIPIPLLAAGYSGPTVWRMMSALYLIAMLAHIGLQRSRGHLTALSAGSKLRAVLIGLPLISALICGVNAVGLGGSISFSLYIASLILGLAFAGLVFLLVSDRMTREEQT